MTTVCNTETGNGTKPKLQQTFILSAQMLAIPVGLARSASYLGFGGQYAPSMAGKEVRAAVAALNVVMAEDEPAAAQGAR
ncbi:hypothetical protein ACVWZM_001578 [Bradyrhizobium sp. USDA 4501]